MLKSNFSNSSMLLSKKKPVLFKDTADDTPPLTPVPKDPLFNPVSSNARGSLSVGTKTDLENKMGTIPRSLDERFQWYLENNSKQEKKAAESKNIILEDIQNAKYASLLSNAAKQLKQNWDSKVTTGMKQTISADPYAQTRQSDQSGARGVPTNKSSSTSGIPDEHAELAAIVDKLPENFDLTKWDDMTAFQQQNALKKSDLSGTDQMKLLNAPTSIKTIATIQDIQANRAQYGITQARANEISSELLKIANARIGVNNRALPFASDFQRNLFLKQLDKEEQKLLKSVGGQDNSGSGMLPSDKQVYDSSKPIIPYRRGVIKKIETYSKLVSVAKDVLKAYINIQYILPSALALLPMKEAGKLIDEGTVSFGMQDNASLFFAGGKNGSMGLAMDSTGDIGALRTRGKYLGVPSIAVVVFASVSNADRLRDLEGQSLVVGGSIGETLTIGADMAFFTDKSGKEKFAVNLELGFGYSQLPVEGHVGSSETLSFVDPTGEDETWKIYNIYDVWEKCVKKVLEW